MKWQSIQREITAPKNAYKAEGDGYKVDVWYRDIFTFQVWMQNDFAKQIPYTMSFPLHTRVMKWEMYIIIMQWIISTIQLHCSVELPTIITRIFWCMMLQINKNILFYTMYCIVHISLLPHASTRFTNYAIQSLHCKGLVFSPMLLYIFNFGSCNKCKFSIGSNVVIFRANELFRYGIFSYARGY